MATGSLTRKKQRYHPTEIPFVQWGFEKVKGLDNLATIVVKQERKVFPFISERLLCMQAFKSIVTPT